MRITEKQLMILFNLAVWFSQLNMSWRGLGPPFSRELIESIVSDIYNQQSDKIVDTE